MMHTTHYTHMWTMWIWQIVVLILFFIVFWWISKGESFCKNISAEELLKRRLAKGEIDSKEYKRILNEISK